jgi:hypothetical protein
MRIRTITSALWLTAALISGCGDAPAVQPRTAAAQAQIDGARYMLAEEPDDAIGVIEARQSASDGATLTVVGRIGGTSSPWVDGRAAFTLLDASLVLVAEGTDAGDAGDGQICTGDCCATERAHATMLVKILGDNGRVLVVDSRDLLGIAENDMVVVRGTAKKDKNGNVTLVADAVFVRR